tara:strand:+ start:289 stop:639 length:351 start_codon:yes stop_codon:yes gene_type:complete
MQILHEQLRELEEKAEKIGLKKSPFKFGWMFPFLPLSAKFPIETTSRYEARIKMLIEIGKKENINPGYLKFWAESKYQEIDWEEQVMLDYQQQVDLYHQIKELEKKIKAEDEKETL